MGRTISLRLKTFVDRKGELAHFCDLLTGQGKPIFAIWGPEGRGKTTLMSRLRKECHDRDISAIQFTWQPKKKVPYTAIMSKIAKQCGRQHFSAFYELREKFVRQDKQLDITLRSIGHARVAEGATFEGSEVNKMAGTLIEQLNIDGIFGNREEERIERRLRLTANFAEGLSEASREKPIVLFFDGIDEASEETQTWFFTDICDAFDEDSVGNTYVVIFTSTEPPIHHDAEIYVDCRPLARLSKEHIAEFIRLRGCDLTDTDSEYFAEELLRSGAEMRLIDKRVKSFLEDQSSGDHANV